MSAEELKALRYPHPEEVSRMLKYYNSGKEIPAGSPEFHFSGRMTQRALLILSEMNSGYCDAKRIQEI